MLIGQGGFVNTDKIRGKDLFQITKPVLEAVLTAMDVDGSYLPVQNGDALNVLKVQSADSLIPVTQYAVRAGMAADKVFNLLRQRRRRMGDHSDRLFRALIDNEFVFQNLTSLLLFHLPEETGHGDCGCQHTVQRDGQKMCRCVLKVST